MQVLFREASASFFVCRNIYYNGDNMSKETFKLFARNHPELAYQVMDGKTNWQKLYELYEIYGEDSEIWSDYSRMLKILNFL